MAEAAKAESTALVPVKPKPELVAGGRVAPIVPRTVDEVGRVAMAVIRARLAPASYDGHDEGETQSKIMIGIMKGAEVGLPPITALSTIAIINNRPCIWGDGAVALVQQSGKVVKVESLYEGEEGKDDFTAIYRIWRKDQEIAYEGRFSIADGKRANLIGNPKRQPWVLYPKRMLMMRARAFALRDGFADCLNGLAIAEEAQDIPEAPPPVSQDLLDDTPPPTAEAINDEPKGANPSPILDDKTPTEWEIVAEDLARQYNDTFPSDRTDFMTDHAKQLSDMWQADPDAHRLFMTKTAQS